MLRCLKDHNRSTNMDAMAISSNFDTLMIVDLMMPTQHVSTDRQGNDIEIW